MDPDNLRPGPSAIGGPRGNALPSSQNTKSSQDLKARLFTGAGGKSMQILPGTRRSTGRGKGSKMGGGFSGRNSRSALVPRKIMRGSQSTPALRSFPQSGASARMNEKRPELLANNFLPEMSQKVDVHESKKTDAPAPPSSAAAASLDVKAAAEQSNHSAGKAKKKRRTDLTFTQMLNLDKATLREFLQGDFLYLKANNDAVSVYDLHIVDHSEIERDLKSNSYFTYWTMSRAGLTQFFESPADAIGPGAEKDPEFTDLETWERDFHIFNVIQGIRFFQQYPMWKSFRMWSKGMRRRKMKAAQRGLNQKLFLLNATLRSSMSQLRRLCVDVSQLGLFEMPLKDGKGKASAAKGIMASMGIPGKESGKELDQWNPLSVEDFIREQVKKRALLADWLIDFSDDVRALVRSACDQVLDSFLARNHIEADHPMTFTEKAALRTECRRLVKFVRLCDMLIRDTLLEVGIESTKNLLEYLHPTIPVDTVTIIHEIDDPKKKGKKKEREVKDFDADGHRVYEDGTTSEDEREEEEKRAKRAAAEAHPCDTRLLLTAEMTVEQIEEVRVSPRETESGEALAEKEAQDSNAEKKEEKKANETEEKTEDEIVRLSVSTVKLTITKEFLIEEIIQCVDDAIRVLAVPEPIMSHEDLQPYVRGANTEGSSDGAAGSSDDSASVVPIDQQVQWSPVFKETRQNILIHLEKSFTSAESYLSVFAPYQRKFEQNEGTLVDVNAAFAATPLDEMEEAIVNYRAQGAMFVDIPRLADVGCIRVSSIVVRTQLLPSPVRCLAAIQDLLPQLIRDSTEALGTEMANKISKLVVIASDAAEYIQQRNFHSKCVKEFDTVGERFDRVQRLLSIVESNFGKDMVPDDIKAHNRMLIDNKENHDSAVEATEQRLDGELPKWSDTIKSQVSDLRSDVENLADLLKNPIIGDPEMAPSAVIEFLQEQTDSVNDLKQKAENYEMWQTTLDLDVDDYEDLGEVSQDANIKLRMWTSLQNFDQTVIDLESTNLENLDLEGISRLVMTTLKTAGAAIRSLDGNPVAPLLKSKVDDFKLVIPSVEALLNPGLQERHWQDIETCLGHKFEEERPCAKYSLGELLKLNIADEEKSEVIQAASTKALQEKVLKDMFTEKILLVWKHLEFEVMNYKERHDTFILGGIEPVMEALDDSLVTLNTILGSRYCTPIRYDVTSWQKKLVLLSETLDEWMQVQQQWMYLETIFSAADIQRQLPAESKKFFEVDKGFRNIMESTNEVPKAAKAGTVQGRKNKLAKYNISLDRIQKSLEAYLETKRQAFPRFYFLSNDELLEILAQVRDPHAVQPHLQKIFDCIQHLGFGEKPGSIDIVSMRSPEKEVVPLGKNLKARGNVEDWLMAVQDRMQKVLHDALKEAVIDYDRRPRVEWIVDGGHPGQCVATAAQIMWSRRTEEALRAADTTQGGMLKWEEENIKMVLDLVVKVRGKLSRIVRKILVALITTDVHAKDMIVHMRKSNVDRVNSFLWEQQLRYYWDADEDDCIIRHANAKLYYCYEYMGCTSRLVITPLTDKCWLTITGAIHLKLGAAPAGPAGTGKTESSKDLAKAMGTFCIVFNCSDQIDYIMIGKLFAGLAQCGCWCCLDEFNRILIEVLSVIAQQLLVLRTGMKNGSERINFEGRNIALKSHCVIVTMNPGYAGRTALPDNLKICFRPVAMMVPNYALIAEIVLYAQGFEDARNLARKMAKLYILASEQLSQQPHYDYGLRAVISVLIMAGGNKRANPDLTEDVVLIKAMRDSNLPKFLADDVPLFRAILVDLFPGVNVPTDDYGALLVAIKAELREHGYQEHDELISKIIQLHDMIKIRFGVTIVGPSCGGKTVAYKIMCAAHSRLKREGHEDPWYQNSIIDIINPKSITMGELYGEFNQMTQEWTDGLGSTMIRAQVREVTDDRLYTMFDGPIDTLWIESLNTVLDDNRMLCLANGERIRLKNLGVGPSEMRMLFEVEDLEQASPATVSRLGVVFYTPSTLGWRPYVKSWIEREMADIMGDEMIDHLNERFETSVDQGLEWRKRNAVEPIPTTDCQTARAICNIFTAQYIRAGVTKEDSSDAFKALIDKMYAFAFVWALGGSIHSDKHAEFDDFQSDVLGGINFGREGCFGGYVYSQAEWAKAKADDPMKGQDPSPKGSFRSWQEIVENFNYVVGSSFFSLVVPTLDTTRFSFLLKCNFERRVPCFFTGSTGTGKSVIMEALISQMGKPKEEGGENVLPILTAFSGQTASKLVQLTIESKLEKKRKDLMGPPLGMTTVIFVDDVNMPTKEEYGAQPPIELIRHLICHRFFYDRDKLFLKNISDFVLFSAAAPPGGGRAEMTQRFSQYFQMLCLPPSSDEVLQSIFESILNGFTSMNKFDEETVRSSGKLVSSTILVYHQIAADLRPTPAKSHYTFNLRDVAKVFQGCMMVRSKEVKDDKEFCRLWVHEVMRVFCDRLVNRDDSDYFKKMLSDTVSRGFTHGWSQEDLFENKELPLIFANFLRPPLEDGTIIYEPLKDVDKAKRILVDQLDDYNMSNPTQMKLVFFDDAIAHICRIARILMQPRGNAMLVGVGGSGKQSVTRMACHMMESRVYQIEMIRGYNHGSFIENLKEIMLYAGVEGKSIAFMLVDTQIVDESFLEDVNNILNTGQVPNMFASDEYNKICEDLRPVMKKDGIDTRDGLRKAFLDRVRTNLHIVLCHSPVGDALRVRCREFPSLINCTTIDWFNQWPVDALRAVAMQFLSDVDLGEEGMLQNMCEACARLHWGVNEFGDDFFQRLRRKVYTTPKSFLDMIELYTELLDEYRGDQKTQQARLKVGVKKLEETNAIVDNLQVELTALAPVLKEKGEQAEKMIVVVTEEQAKAKIVQEKVEKDEAVVGKQAAETKAIADDAQADLDEAMPAFNNALKALDALEKKDIQEIKSFTTPPPAVATVMEAILILFGRSTDWKTAKGLLGEMDFMDQLVKFDKDNIAAKKIKKLNKYIKNPAMQVDAVAKVSTAAKSLCMWVHAMHVYDRVAKTVGPKKALLAKMNKELDAANAKLKGKQDELAAVKEKVANLKQQLDETLAEKKQLEDDSATTARRLKVAEKLTGQLAEERVSWAERVEKFGESIHKLVGDVFIASASVSYYGPFTGLFRKDMVAQWISTCEELKIPISSTADLRRTYNDEVQIRQWQIEGLPTDEVSANNAIMVTKGKRWPLMIDPQEQAKKWVKKMEAKNKIALTRLTDRNMLRDLENCIRIGKPLLIEDIGETLDPGLEPVLQKATFRQGGRLLIRLGDSDVDYDPNFRFYLTTKMPNPHYLPEVCIKVTVINFTVTTSGLEDQLLGDVVVQERPDVEERMNKLVASVAADAKQMQIIDAKILKSLSESEGNILDDVQLIQILDDSKTVAGMIKERMAEADTVMEEIGLIRAGYVKAAVRGSIMYFVMANLANIDPMYQYSLAYFKVLFNECIEKSAKDDDIDTRVENINRYALENIYANVCRGLFEKDKFIFSLLLCVQIMLDRGDVNPVEWSLLLRGAGLAVNPVPNPDVVMQSQLGWNLLYVMEQKLPETFTGLTDTINSNWKQWFRWARAEFPHRTLLPDQAYEEDLTDFQRILLVMALRQEKGSAAAALFVEKKLGRQFVENPPVRLESIYADTNCRLPAVFILSSGADPTGLVYALAKKMNYAERLSTISLGQGQGPKAMKMIENAKKSGDWVMLQNCHLAKSWMITLEALCNEMAVVTLDDGRPNKIHDGFRLYLTSMPATYFPVPVLQNSVKMTVEPPRGLRANILRSLTLMPDWTNWDECDGSNGVEIFRRLAFATCFFHAMVQERIRFGPLGWNIPYEFNDSDLEASIMLLKMFLEEQPDIPWDSLHFMSAVVGYGGRVTDFLDERCIETVLHRFYSPHVLDDDHMFDDKGVYVLPPGSGSLDDFKAYVSGLPLVDPPSVFGMHPNATITVETAQTKYVMNTCLSIQPRDASGGGSGKSTDEVVTELAVDVAERFPSVLTEYEAGPLAFVMRGEYMDSLSTALKQEMVRYNRVIRKLEITLFEIQKAIRGEVLMSAELDEQYTAMNNNQVPANWSAVAFPSLKPLASWISDMIARIDFMRTWLHNGEPISFWLGGFFFPQGFMTGVSQNYSRKYKVAIDTLKWAFKCTTHATHENIDERPDDGVWIYGCYMDGASFDIQNSYVVESKPAQNFQLLPVIQFLPKANHEPDPANYECPCYKTTARFGQLSTTGMSTNYVLNIELPCSADEPPNKWVLMGVACVVNLDD